MDIMTDIITTSRAQTDSDNSGRRGSRLDALSRMKGRTGRGRGTRIADVAVQYYAGGGAALPDGTRAPYVRVFPVLVPEWCRLKDDRLVREHNGAVIYCCPEISAENDRYRLSKKSGENSGASLTRGCLRCGLNRLYNLSFANGLRRYFGDLDSKINRRFELKYNIKRHV